jgi:3,2-trans-enoyl-CoA isomerase
MPPPDPAAAAGGALPPLQPPGLKHVTVLRVGGGAAAAAYSSPNPTTTATTTNSPVASAAAAAAALAAASAPEGSVALLLVAKEPVNSMDTQLWRELHAALRACERDSAVKALIIASSLAKRDVFTAGNDLKELYAPLTSASRYGDFWDAQSSFLCDLLVSPLATAAAIRGACPAGGCCLALCCDRRVIVGSGGGGNGGNGPAPTLGLNEVALGIPVPKFWARLMALRCGDRAAERLCLGGEQVGPEEALRIGLVDEVVAAAGGGNGGEPPPPAAVAVVARAAQWASRQARLPREARHATKLAFRGQFEQAWRAYALTEEAAFGWGAISAPQTVARMRGVLERLGGGGGGKGPSAARAKL